MRRISGSGMQRNSRNRWCSSGEVRSNAECHRDMSAAVRPDLASSETNFSRLMNATRSSRSRCPRSPTKTCGRRECVDARRVRWTKRGLAALVAVVDDGCENDGEDHDTDDPDPSRHPARLPRHRIPLLHQERPAPPPPEPPEPFTMPPDHSGRLRDRQRLPPAGPPLREHHPKGSVPHPESQTSASAGPDQRRDLLPQRKVLERELPLRPKQRPHHPEEGPEESPHPRTVFAELAAAQGVSAGWTSRQGQ